MADYKKIPKSAASVKEKSKIPVAADIDYASSYPCWRFSHFDKDGPWGLNSLLKFTFHYAHNIYECVSESGIQQLDDALKELDGKELGNKSVFWGKLKSICQCDIPINVVEEIEEEIIHNVFIEKIYPKLIALESNTWDEIRQQSHSKKKESRSNNHDVLICDLCNEAQERLKLLKFNDRDTIYSLRLENLVRIYGFREQNYLDIIWVDLEHKVYPPKK